ncbi:MAG: hypothetical protein WCF94_02650 [bacterium]
MENINNILRLLFLSLKQEYVVAVLWYGNKKGDDTDLFVVLKADCPYQTYQILYLDVVCVGESYISKLAENLDPVVIEPIKTGELIYGDISKFVNITNYVTVTSDTSIYLARCSLIFYGWGVSYSFQNNHRAAIQNLCFSYSYLLFATEYFKGDDIVLFKRLLSSDNTGCLAIMRKKLKSARFLCDDDIKQSFEMTRCALLDFLPMVEYKQSSFHTLWEEWYEPKQHAEVQHDRSASTPGSTPAD